MKKLSPVLRRIPKRVVGLTVAALAVVTPAMVMAWGPDRPTYTMENPAPHVTFNSITNNPNYGDEREFMTVKDLTTGETLGGSTKLVPGHEYHFQVYVHNNAASNLNASGKGVAKDVVVRAALPSSVTGEGHADGFVTASNATPKEVYDTATLTSDGKVELDFVEGSAMLHTNQQQTKLSDAVITSGVKVGHKDLTGTWNGCLEFAGAVTFKVKVKAQPNFTMEKKVSKQGANQWNQDYAAKPGETVDFLITYKNTGNTKQENIVVKDTLPAGLTYIPGSTKLGNASNPGGKTLSDNLTKGGVNIGHYTPGSNAWVMFSAKVADNDQLPACGANTLRNVAAVETDNGSKEDDANVKTDKECEEPKEPVYACTGLSVQTIERTKFKFTATKQVENAEFVKFVYVIRDAEGKEISRSENDTYTQTKVGSYTVQAYLTVKVDGEEKTVTDDKCKKPFEVTEEPVENVYACESLTKIEKSRDTFEFTAKAQLEGNVKVKEYMFDFGDGETLIVGAEQTTVSHTYKEARDYTATVAVTFEVDGKTVAGITSDTCKVDLTVKPVPPTECKPGIPEGDERCEEKPEEEVPTELPSTGPGAVLGGLFGSSALGLGVHSWLSSRRSLQSIYKK